MSTLQPMAMQKFSLYQRRAIWEIHGKRCAYCRDPLDYANVEIDHILPESLLQNHVALEQMLATQGLTSAFDIQGLENLAPSCWKCNNRKSSAAFNPGRLAIELGVAARLKLQIAERIEKLVGAEKLEKLRFALAAAVESGGLSELDVANVVAVARANAGIFKLSSPQWLVGDEPLGELSTENQSRYLNAPVALPESMATGLRLQNDENAETFVNTLFEYESAVARGFYVLSTFEMAVASNSFERPLAVLKILVSARVANQSFIDSPRCGLSDISLMPADIMFTTADMTSDPACAGQRDALCGKTIQDLVTIGEVKIVRVGSDLCVVEYNGGRTLMFEILRADLNGDGIQDLLIHWGGGSTDGTYSSASIVALTRTSNTALFEPIYLLSVHTAR